MGTIPQTARRNKFGALWHRKVITVLINAWYISKELEERILNVLTIKKSPKFKAMKMLII